ncbi:MAG: hypothetical protein ACLFM8_07250 [Halobacteriales archaeon]
MRRRGFLAAGAGAITAGLAGCTVLGDDADLRRHSMSNDPGRTDLVYTHQDERMLVISVRDRPPIGGDLTTVRLLIEQHADTYLEDVRIRLLPTLEPTTHLEYLLKVPSESAFKSIDAVRDGDSFDLSLSDDEDDRGIAKVVDVGLTASYDDLNGPLEISHESVLAEPGMTGDTYTVEDTTDLEFGT